VGDAAAPHVDEPGPGHFQPGVGLDIQDALSPPSPVQASSPGVGPLPPLPPSPPSPSLEPGEARHRQEDRTVVLPDGSQFQFSRRSSRSRVSRTPARYQGYKVEDSSEEEGNGPSPNNDDDDDEGPGPFYTPLSGPSPPRRDLSPPPNPVSPGEPDAQGGLEHTGTPEEPATTGNTPGGIRGLGRRLTKVKQHVSERWVTKVRKPPALSPSPDRPALPSTRPAGSTPNLTPHVPARLEEPGPSLSPDPGPRGAEPLQPRSPDQQAAPQHTPARSRRLRQPPARYQSEDFTPAQRVKKEVKDPKKRKQ
jgi:hypothetical protein